MPRPVEAIAPIYRAEANSVLAGFVAWGFTALILVGFITFRIEGTLARGNMMSVDRALFTVVNAATLTGFQLPLAIDHYNWPGQWMTLLLTIGGTQFALIVGGIAVARIARLPYTDKQIVFASLGAQLAVLVVGSATLIQAHQPILASMIQSCSAFGNSGVWMGDDPTLLNWRTHLILLPLAILGGLGLPVLMDLCDALRRKRDFSPHTLAVLKLSAIVYLVGLTLCFVLRWPSTPTAARLVFLSSSEAAINTRSAGLPIEFAADFPRYLQWVLIVLMAIGAAPGGTAGGIKVTTVGRLFAGMRDIFLGRNPGRVFGIAVAWLGGFVLLVFLALLVLLWSEPGMDADRLLFMAASAAANVGLAHDRIGIVGAGMYALTLTMLLGRILPVMILWWVIRHADETDVAIG